MAKSVNSLDVNTISMPQHLFKFCGEPTTNKSAQPGLCNSAHS